MGLVACLGLATTLIVSFTVLAAVLQILHDHRVRRGQVPGALPREAARRAGRSQPLPPHRADGGTRCTLPSPPLDLDNPVEQDRGIQEARPRHLIPSG